MGVDVFLEHHTHLVADARVGLITNPTGRTKTGITTIDALQQHPDVNLVALFALEHGIKAKAKAGEHVRDTQIDNLPVYSLYGSDRSLQSALDNIDVIIYDIQDVGSRAYTYIWSLAKIIKAAGEHDKRVIVLDRPNPLGGRTIDGPITEEKWRSLVGGYYPVPRAYGLTAGELARYLNREHLLACSLTVVPMKGYQRNTRWTDIGREWIPPSPNIPSPQAAITFAATGTIGALGTVHIGIGTDLPFQIAGAPWINAKKSTRALNALQLPGIEFQPIIFEPDTWLFRDKKVQAIFLHITDPITLRPTRTEISILVHLVATYPEFKIPKDRYKRFDQAMGTSAVREALLRGDTAREIWERWEGELEQFSTAREKYFLY
jgi:uncharacterized protein YbbC (DUF1343 family)